MWQKLWHREPKTKPPANETPKQKKARISAERKANRDRPFEEKESYRWVEALIAVEKQLQKVEKQFREVQDQLEEPLEEEPLEKITAIGQKTRIIHIFDREGDIAPCL